MRLSASLAALAASLAALAAARSAAGDRLLVVADDAAQYSDLLAALARRGFAVDVRAAANTSVALSEDGRRLYDHAALLAPAAKRVGAGLTAQAFVRFVNDGGNLLVAASSAASDLHRALAAQFGAEFARPGSRVVDHQARNATADHATVAAAIARPAAAAPILSPDLRGPVYFRGIAHRCDPANPLLTPVLTAARSTYSTPLADPPLAGRALALVSVLQTRRNARVAISGSADLFSDALAPTNRRFVRDLLQWTFQEKAVLRETAHSHRLAGAAAADAAAAVTAATHQPEHYRIGNDIVYDIALSVYHDDAWHPYVADDVQFEAIMLDPYLRLTLNRTRAKDTATATATATASATYRGRFKLPDRYGTFTFRVNYKRTGYSNVDVRDTVAIWPLRHDEYPRFLTAAYPYYVGSLVMVLGFLALCAVWLWSADPAALANNHHHPAQPPNDNADDDAAAAAAAAAKSKSKPSKSKQKQKQKSS
ncbi:oligosaccharyl transferase glycoprotein complex, beta subunit [Coemansia javaensis]|uniref:Dolichyl-diphosphooligosaccharide--protein glycosyltransferase subunit WBP1 n=1 Tax=Coemansia javaensis TaxID=2761396 RepID=A0A9W8HFL9_9FUNG|nr:oligosaccharyl transferase glycoprotein complex, beta subunit [Coemansia javaensis]